MSIAPIWLTGTTRSGKTSGLVAYFTTWVTQQQQHPEDLSLSGLAPQSLILTANSDNRRTLADQLVSATGGKYPAIAQTPLGFFSDEVILFYPLLFETLHLRAQFPLQLRPETEQELATQLWQDTFTQPLWQETGVSEYRLVRLILDLLQLAGASGIDLETVPSLLQQGLGETEWAKDPKMAQAIGQLLQEWRDWCLTRGLLTYGLIYELYWRYLLPHPTYQRQLRERYRAIFADDVDDYPAIARHLFDFLLDQNVTAVFTYNPDGAVRLGLGADPHYLEELAGRCHRETLTPHPDDHLGAQWGETLVQAVTDPFNLPTLPASFQAIQAINRSTLLRQTTNFIIDAIQRGIIQPRDIAIIAPGLDEIARYTLIEILTKAGINVNPLNEQRPLISSALVRGLLTLIALIYPGLGRTLSKDSVAEMLVVLSQSSATSPSIDPVRAGLIADHCYVPDYDNPRLLPHNAFPRWDRLGHQAVTAYTRILDWIEAQRQLYTETAQKYPPRFYQAIQLLDHATRDFFNNGSNLPYFQLSALRELSETVQHYWDVQKRLQRQTTHPKPFSETVSGFIQLLRLGTITANAYPLNTLSQYTPNTITLATIYQYRSLRSNHRWQFWLDAGSHLWRSGGAATLYGAPLFLQERIGQPFTPEDEEEMNQERLERVLRDLLGRVTESVYFCHSDLAVNGTEQNGDLLPLIHGATIVELDPVVAER